MTERSEGIASTDLLERDSGRREYKKLWMRRWRSKLSTEDHAKFLERRRIYLAKWREKNRKAERDRIKSWRQSHPDNVRRHGKNARQKLTGRYIRCLLSANTGLSHTVWPEPVVELKRQLIKLRRLTDGKTERHK